MKTRFSVREPYLRVQSFVVRVAEFFGEVELGCPLAPKEAPPDLEIATFAGNTSLASFPLPRFIFPKGGSFWGLQLAFQRVPGVLASLVGYTQGHLPYPCYSMVLTDKTGHALALQVLYDPEQVSYDDLIDELFRLIDPTTVDRQREDVGNLYRSGIYYHSEEQRQIASEKLKKMQEEIDAGSFRDTAEKEVVVELKPAGDFFVGEQFHQRYLERGGRSGELQSVEKGCKDPIKWFV